MNAITVCVGYDKLLGLTLPHNRQHFDRVLVVTSMTDRETVGLVDRTPGAIIHRTDAFTRDGADFNKGLAIEEGLDALGREGWVCLLDADVALPKAWPYFELETEAIYLCRRRMCYVQPEAVPEGWDAYPVHKERPGVSGFFQLFHAEATALGEPPWYPVDWKHAGGSDTEFVCKWPEGLRKQLPFEVLHFGRPFRNWCGQSPAGRVKMRRYWKSRMQTGDYESEKLPPKAVS